MAPLLRPRKQCFYCGQRSSQHAVPGIRSFQCEHCQAVNHLDRNGTITDPPLQEVTSSNNAPRFAKPSHPMSTSSSLFCDTCLKNQQISTGILSEYLPEPGQPGYDHKVANYSQFKKELDARYPPVCPECEPRVRERMKQQGYLAKTDHLKRLMDRSRQKTVAPRWTWRNHVVRLGGLGQLISALTYMFWALAVVLAGLRRQSDGLELSPQLLIKTCITNLVLNQPTSLNCLHSLSKIAGWGLLLGLLSMWWNPRWQYKLEGNFGRLKGLTRYYRLQTLIHLIRSAVWMVCLCFSTHDSKVVWAINVVASPLLLLLTVTMLKSIHIEVSPIKTWQTDVPPLIEPGSFVRTQPTSVLRAQPVQTFPIANLAPKEPKRELLVIPPPPTDDAEESMEWEPSGNLAFRPTSYSDRYPQKSVQPSPFYGRIPPKPTNHLLKRNAQVLPPPKDSIGLAPGHFDKPQIGPETIEPPQPTSFAHPTFFPSKDLRSDTGLETIFTKVFSLGESFDEHLPQAPADAVPAISNEHTTQPNAHLQQVADEVTKLEHIFNAVLLSCLLCGWIVGFFLEKFGQEVQSVILFAIICLLGMSFLRSMTSRTRLKSVDGLLHLTSMFCWALSKAHQTGHLSIGENLDRCVVVAMAMKIYLEVSRASSPRQAVGLEVVKPEKTQHDAVTPAAIEPVKVHIPSTPTTPTSGCSTDSDSDTASEKTWSIRRRREESPGLKLGSLRLSTDAPFGGKTLQSRGVYGRKYR